MHAAAARENLYEGRKLELRSVKKTCQEGGIPWKKMYKKGT